MKNLNKRETHTDPFSDFKSVLSLGITIGIDLRLILHITNTQAHETVFINIISNINPAFVKTYEHSLWEIIVNPDKYKTVNS